jgi:hypothetical protein
LIARHAPVEALKIVGVKSGVVCSGDNAFGSGWGGPREKNVALDGGTECGLKDEVD